MTIIDDDIILGNCKRITINKLHYKRKEVDNNEDLFQPFLYSNNTLMHFSNDCVRYNNTHTGIHMKLKNQKFITRTHKKKREMQSTVLSQERQVQFTSNFAI